MGDQRFRNKITWFSFLFSLLVVWIHACNAELFLGSGEAAVRVNDIERFLADGIGQIAVPGFFMISGYLFFRDFDWSRLEGKWMRRIKSTLVPYILWNFLYYAGYVVASRIPGLSEVVGKGTVRLDIEELVGAVLHFKYNPVFWYLFQLILLIILAPVIYLFIKSIWGRVLLFTVLGLMLIFNIYLPFLNTDALFYYSLAGTLALNSKTRSVCESQEGTRRRAAVCILVILAAAAFYILGSAVYWPVCFVICRTLVAGGLWFLVPAAILPEAGKVVSHHFFLYATHFAFVRLINKGAALLLPEAFHAAAIPLILFIVMPLLALAFSTLIYNVLNRLSPRLCLLLNGGRE